MTVNLETLAVWIGVCGVIITPVTIIVRKANELLKSINNLKSWTAKQQKDIDIANDERRILISGQLACLKGLQEQGCNGPVTKSIDELEDFLSRQAHVGISKSET